MTLIGEHNEEMVACLLVSVTHTTPPGGRLCMVVMIHHSWLSGTLLSEENDIISIFQLGRVRQGGSPSKHGPGPWGFDGSH